jgi:hypothetical protein
MQRAEIGTEMVVALVVVLRCRGSILVGFKLWNVIS